MSDSVIWEIMRESLQLFTVLLIDFTSSEERSHLARGTLTEPPRPASELKLTALQAHGYVKTPLPCPALPLASGPSDVANAKITTPSTLSASGLSLSII